MAYAWHESIPGEPSKGSVPVADRLDLPGHGRIDDLGGLFYDSKRLAEALTGRGDDVAQAGPFLLAGGGQAGSDVTGRIAVGLQPPRPKSAQGRLKVMTERLELRAQRQVIERKPGRVLQDPQRLPGPVGIPA